MKAYPAILMHFETERSFGRAHLTAFVELREEFHEDYVVLVYIEDIEGDSVSTLAFNDLDLAIAGYFKQRRRVAGIYGGPK